MVSVLMQSDVTQWRTARYTCGTWTDKRVCRLCGTQRLCEQEKADQKHVSTGLA